jgi:ribonuclease P protein component
VQRAASVWLSEAGAACRDSRPAQSPDARPGRNDPVIGRLVRSADFERVLRTRTRASSTHFAIHHLPERPSRPHKPALARELSTGAAPILVEPVDDLPRQTPAALWLGAVVPKRHARRAVTRTLLKRQIRSVVDARACALLGGLWVVRLRAPFDKARFPSAASDALRLCAREELELLLSAAALRAGTR